MLLGHERYGAPTAIFNAYLFNGLMAAAASLAAALLRPPRRASSALRATARTACEPVLIALATLWLLSTAALEIDTFVAARFVPRRDPRRRQRRSPLLYAALAARLDWPTIAWPAVAHAPFLLLVGRARGGAAR